MTGIDGFALLVKEIDLLTFPLSMMTQPGSDVVYFRLGGSKPRCCPLLTLPRTWLFFVHLFSLFL